MQLIANEIKKKDAKKNLKHGRSLFTLIHLINKDTLGGIASICFRFHFQHTLRMHTQGCQGCQKTRNFVRNSKILISRSTIQPKWSKIKYNLPYFKEFWWIAVLALYRIAVSTLFWYCNIHWYPYHSGTPYHRGKWMVTSSMFRIHFQKDTGGLWSSSFFAIFSHFDKNWV